MNPGICATSSCMRRDVFRYAPASAPSRRWVLKMTTTSVGSFTRRYDTSFRSQARSGHCRERAVKACPLRPTSPAVLRAVYEFQSGPRFIHGTDLHVDEALGQGGGAHDILGQVGRDSGCLLRPRDPEASIWRENFFPSQEPRFQVRASPNEGMDYVHAAVQPLPDCDALRKSTQEPLVIFRRMDDDHGEALFDPEFLRQRLRRGTGGHRRGPTSPPPPHVFCPARQGAPGRGPLPFPRGPRAPFHHQPPFPLLRPGRLPLDLLGVLLTHD